MVGPQLLPVIASGGLVPSVLLLGGGRIFGGVYWEDFRSILFSLVSWWYSRWFFLPYAKQWGQGIPVQNF